MEALMEAQDLVSAVGAKTGGCNLGTHPTFVRGTQLRQQNLCKQTAVDGCSHLLQMCPSVRASQPCSIIPKVALLEQLAG